MTKRTVNPNEKILRSFSIVREQAFDIVDLLEDVRSYDKAFSKEIRDRLLKIKAKATKIYCESEKHLPG